MAHETNQPSAKPPMEEKPSGTGSMVKDVGGEYLKGAAKEGGQRTMEYEAEHGQEQLDEAKAKAQGMWTKYCGCLA